MSNFYEKKKQNTTNKTGETLRRKLFVFSDYNLIACLNKAIVMLPLNTILTPLTNNSPKCFCEKAETGQTMPS